MLTHNDKGFLVHLAREKKVGKFKISDPFDPTGTAFISDSTWLHETVFLAGLNANGWDCSTRTLVAIIMNYQHVRELPKNVQFCPTF